MNSRHNMSKDFVITIFCTAGIAGYRRSHTSPEIFFLCQ